MTIIDSHCHASPVWYEPVDTLLFQMDRIGIDRAVVTQMIGQFDNSYQQACVAAHPDRLVSVVLVDPSTEDAADRLSALVDAGAAGVRIGAAVTNDALWETAHARGIPVSVSGNAAQITASVFTDRLAAMPDLQCVLEHLGGLARPDFDGSAETREAVFALNRFSNMCLKMPGLGQLGKRTSLANDPPIYPAGAELLRETLGRFGSDRLMWASDFPPVATREGYANALIWPLRVLADLAESERNAIFGGNAARLFWKDRT